MVGGGRATLPGRRKARYRLHMNPASPITPTELPPQPERPDCCAGGCATCVLDGWYEDMERWRAQVDAILAERAAAESAPPAASPD